MILHAYVDVYVLCVCIVNHGHGYTTIYFVEKLTNLIKNSNSVKQIKD